VGTDLFNFSCFQVDPVKTPRVVRIRYLLTIGRPDRIRVKAGTVQLESLGFILAILAADVEFIFSGLV
jgi:hypothetical protein